MPRSTLRWRFELKVLDALGRWGERHLGESASAGFALVFAADGTVLRTISAREGPAFRDVEAPDGGGVLVFDPFDAPEYLALRWVGLDPQRMQDLLDLTLDAEDFRPVQGEGPVCTGFPSTHLVVF